MFLKQILAKRNPQLITIASTASIQDAARLLFVHQIGALLVMDEVGEAVGMLSERDLTRCIHQYGFRGPDKTVSTIMSRDLVSCTIDDDLKRVMQLMNARHVRHLPVTEQGRPVGMVSVRDVIEHLLEETAGERDGLREYISTGTC